MTVVAVFGPTASGKSDIAVALAELVGGEIVSCDAMQLYAGLPILTNQPSPRERERVRHHLVGAWPLEHEGSVAEYARLAHAAIDDVLARGGVPVVCGGSGLYLRAALADLPLPPPPGPARAPMERAYDRLGAARAHRLLARRDAAAAAAVHPNDRRRVVRALELHALGTSLAPAADTLWSAATRHPAVVAGIERPPGEVRARIERRTAAMFAAGVVDEVRAARSAHRFSHTAERIHGLQDLTALLAGEIDADEAMRRMIVRTARYAKRQRTWMRRIAGLRPVDASAGPSAAARAVAAWL